MRRRYLLIAVAFLGVLLLSAGLWGEFSHNGPIRQLYSEEIYGSIVEARLSRDMGEWQKAVEYYDLAFSALRDNPFMTEEQYVRDEWLFPVIANAALTTEHRTREFFEEIVVSEIARKEKERSNYKPASAQSLLEFAERNTAFARMARDWDNDELRVMVLRSGANNLIYPLWLLLVTGEEDIRERLFVEAATLAIEAQEAADSLGNDRWRFATRLTEEFLLRPPRDSEGNPNQPQAPQDGQQGGRRKPGESPSWGDPVDGPPQSGFGDMVKDGSGKGRPVQLELLPMPGAGKGRRPTGH